MSGKLYRSLALLCALLFLNPAPASAQRAPRSCQENSFISTFAGDTLINTCTGDDNRDRVRFKVEDFRQAFAYVVVDAGDRIVYLNFHNFIDFDMLPVGVLRVYAFSTYGRITASVGDRFSTATLSRPCFGLTRNFVTVMNGAPGGDNDITIGTTDGRDSLRFCPGDGLADEVNFTAEGSDDPHYVVTDAAGNVLLIDTSGTVDFDGATLGLCRVYAYDGPPPFGPGFNVSGLSGGGPSECGFGLSQNFITVLRTDVEGGRVTTSAGDTVITVCPGDGRPDRIEFVSSEQVGTNRAFIITNEDNVVVFLPQGDFVDFNNAPAGVCRVWGVAYEGDFIATTGSDVDEERVSTGCFDLSDNFVLVIRESPDPGTIATTDGLTEVTTCPGDGIADPVVVALSGNDGTSALAYVLTDADGQILEVSDQARFDLGGRGEGTFLIYGLAYTGDLNDDFSGGVAGAVFSTGCFRLTPGAVTVTAQDPIGGSVATAEGDTTVTICPGDGMADSVRFVASGNVGDSFTFVVTDENNAILGIPPADVVDFDDAGPGTCRLWGLSYQGELLLEQSDDLLTTTAATGCSDLSGNFVTVVREQPTAGTITLQDGSTEATVCPMDGNADILTFVSEGGTASRNGLVITDENGVILSFPISNSVNFDNVPAGVCRVYAISYTGTIIAQRGDRLADGNLTDGCFGISDDFVTVNRTAATTGDISTEDGETAITVCPGDNQPDAVFFDSTGTSLERFNYLVTDTNDVVLQVAFTDRINFESFPLGVCRVYGLGYSGLIRARPGTQLGEDQLSTGCSALSTNFVTVSKELPSGGSVNLSIGGDEVMVCPRDGVADLVEVFSTGASGSNFTFLLTTNENVVIRFQEEGTFDFDNAVFGRCRIWGLSYQGDLVAAPGDTVGTDPLASGCANLSDNFVVVVREEVMGGSVSLEGGATDTTTCPNDGNADLLRFVTTGATGARQVYVVTDDNDVVLDIVEVGNEADFEEAGVGVCRVWSLSFAGDLLLMSDDTLTGGGRLSSGCFALSDNFVTVNRQEPEAGTLALNGGVDTVLSLCNNGALELNSTDNQVGTLDVALVDADGNLVGFLGRDSLDLSTLSGDFTVVEVAFSGELTAVVGAPFPGEDGAVASGCSDLSDNPTPPVLRLTAVDGGRVALADGSERIFLCPDNTSDGQQRFVTTSGLTDENYVYVLALNNDVILRVIDGAEFDFDASPLNEQRIYGISYTGELLAGPGVSLLTGELATGCADVSDNFVEVLNFSPEAGTISVPGVDGAGVRCSANGEENLAVTVSGNSRADYAILVTDTAGIVQLIAEDPAAVPFGSLPLGDYLVWGLSFTGNLSVAVGDDVDVVALADNCFELTEDAILLTQGGTIEAGELLNETNGADTVRFCSSDAGGQLVIVSATVSGPNYRYIITDGEGDIVVPNLPSTVISFNRLPIGDYRIYGFNFNGNATAFFGRNVETSPLSDSCYAVTTNFITVIKEGVETDSVTTADGQTELTVTVGTGSPVEVAFTSGSDTAANFTYVVTDAENVILTLPPGNVADFDGAGPGVCRVWGLLYEGELLAAAGQNAATEELATGCFALSPNFVTVTRNDSSGIATDPELDEAGAGGLRLRAAPNPVAGQYVTIRLDSEAPIGRSTLTLYDLNGQPYAVERTDIAGRRGSVSFDTAGLPAGIYLVHCRTPEGVRTVRFIKQ